MNKFNIFLPIASILLLASTASAANYLVTESAPVYPGDTTYVYVPIQNMGFGTFMEDVSVRLEPKENASANAVTILDNAYSLGTINDWGDQRTAKFRIHVNPDAIEGDYYFNVFITYKGQETNTGTPPLVVTTKLEDQILTIKGRPLIMLINSSVNIVAPMSVNTETLLFRNAGTGTVENVVAEINIDSSNSPFSILGGGKQFFLGSMKPNDEASITFDLAVDISALPGVYKIPIRVSGQDNFSSNNVIGLVVAGTTNFDISYQETLGSFSLNVINVGISNANAVTVNIPRQRNFTITGASSSVLGNLNPGDYISALFQITQNPGGGDVLQLDIQYTDTSGERHTIPKSLPVVLTLTGAQAGASRGGGTNWILWLLLAVVVLVLYSQREKIKSIIKKQKAN